MATTEETLGAEFWVQPDTALDETFRLMYSQLLQVFREEVRERDGGALDYMIVERLAFMYVFLRMREADSEMTDRNRRELQKDWLELATSMKKLWTAEDKENASENLLKKVNKAVLEVVKDLPANQSIQIQQALAESFASQGL